MIKHLIGIVATIVFVLLCTLLPFLPGRYDALAVPLSAMAQVAGTLGLVLVPFGLLWIAADHSQRLVQWQYVFSLLGLTVASFVWAGVSLIAAMQSGFALGAATLALWIYGLRKAWPRRGRGPTPQPRSALPFYMVTVPVAVALLQFALVERAVDFSRNRAILRSAPLVAAIEQYRTTRGHYPTSLLSVWKDYSPDVIGVREYYYEPHGDAYNLCFEQFTYQIGTREFVMYNPRDEHVMTSHAIDLLQLMREQLALERARGHYALHESPHAHWKYFWFD